MIETSVNRSTEHISRMYAVRSIVDMVVEFDILNLDSNELINGLP